MNKYFPIDQLRSTLRDLKRKTAEIGSEAPTWDRILTVKEHEGALDPSRPVVIGDRGTGKSFWTGTLLDPQKRDRLSVIYGRLGLNDIDVVLGFGGDEFTSEHPTSAELVSLLRQGFEAEQIWRAVILSFVPAQVRPDTMNGTWEERVRWVAESPSLRRDAFQAVDRHFLGIGRRLLVTFDALDTMGSRWDDIATLMRGLLRVGLFLRSARSLSIKLFLRPDMADDPTLWAVGDSSKLRYDEVTLTWARRDLYALLIQYLANDERTRSAVENYSKASLGSSLLFDSERYQPPLALMSEEAEQRKFFTTIAGEYMGRSATKGRTYTWVSNHLANARGYSAPRSFLQAMSVAAESSKSSETALDVPGIQEGVRQASQSRMRELREDYRWIDAVFRPLRDASVPMERKELIKRWRDEKVISVINREIEADETGRYLPPPRVSAQADDPSTHTALLETLEHLSIVEPMGDGRVNMPDLFRLAAGMKRMGGVKLRP